MTATATKRQQRGLTIVELVMFILIVGIAVTGVLHVISLNVGQSADPIRRKQAMAIAESLMDEIRAARFTFCDVSDPAGPTATSAADCATPEALGPEAGDGARPLHNVNDYGNADGTPKAYAADAIGTPFPAGYAATVQIRQAALGPAAGQVPATEGLQVVVTVTYAGEAVSLESYRTRFAPTVY